MTVCRYRFCSLTARAVAILFAVGVAAGCVSTSTFESKVAELQDARQHLEALQNEHSALVRKEVALRSEHEALRSQYDSACRERDTFKVTSEDLRKRLEAAESEANKIDDERFQLKEELSSSRQSLSGQISELIERSGRLASENAELARRISGYETELLAREKRIATLSVALAEREQEVRTLNGRVEEQERKIGELTGTYESLVQEMKGEIQAGQIEITRMKDQLTVQMVDRLLFSSGSAEINAQGREVMTRVGKILTTVPDREIRVEGHTDNVPIGSRIQERFPTNWELSTARATNVVRFLAENSGIPAERLAAVGLGEHRPIAPNDTTENRQRNRRIGIVLVPLGRDQVSAPPSEPDPVMEPATPPGAAAPESPQTEGKSP